MKHLKSLSFVFALVLSISISMYLSKPVNSVPPVDKPPDGDFVAGYKNWTRVNSEPQIVYSSIAMQCTMPTREQLSLEDQNPHRDKFVVVYVNSIGRSAMMEQKWPRFPQRSIIVRKVEYKRKYDSRTPDRDEEA